MPTNPPSGDIEAAQIALRLVSGTATKPDAHAETLAGIDGAMRSRCADGPPQRPTVADAAGEISLCSKSSSLSIHRMTVQNIEEQNPFTTKDGSTIRSILDRTNAPVEKQSLAEASLPAGSQTQLHYHKLSEEFYFILSGNGTMTINDEERLVAAGDAILIPAGSWHTIAAVEPLRFLCCCAPPYAHADTFFQ